MNKREREYLTFHRRSVNKITSSCMVMKDWCLIGTNEEP
jgi:hypothetical protein